MADELINNMNNMNLDNDFDQEEEHDEVMYVEVHFIDGTTAVALFCPDCFCLVKRVDICHRCCANEDYWDEEEYAEHTDFIERMDYVTEIIVAPAA